jgi:hypothetical protein
VLLPLTTLSSLERRVIHVRGRPKTDQVVRNIPRSDVKTVNAYVLDSERALTRDIRRMLADLEGAMPQWLVVAKSEMLHSN